MAICSPQPWKSDFFFFFFGGGEDFFVKVTPPVGSYIQQTFDRNATIYIQKTQFFGSQLVIMLELRGLTDHCSQKLYSVSHMFWLIT